MCGSSRLMREMLGHVLKESFGPPNVFEMAEPEPVLPLNTLQQSGWLIWFLNSRWDLPVALQQILTQPIHLNLFLVASDGYALVRRSDEVELNRADLSLTELLGILRAPLEPWHAAPLHA